MIPANSLMNASLFFLRLKKLVYAIQSKQSIDALIRHLVLAGSEHRRVLDPNLNTIIDIGANRGQFSLAARRWSPKANVIAFEPLEKPAEIFRRIFQGDAKVALHQAAIGPQAGEAMIHVAAADDSSSLLPITALQEKLFPGTWEIGTEKIIVSPLSDFVSGKGIAPPAMLKLDVQGYEFQALQGCADLLDQFDRIYVECSFMELYAGQKLAGDVVRWMRAKGFSLRNILNTAYDSAGNRVQADFLFKKVKAVK